MRIIVSLDERPVVAHDSLRGLLLATCSYLVTGCHGYDCVVSQFFFPSSSWKLISTIIYYYTHLRSSTVLLVGNLSHAPCTLSTKSSPWLNMTMHAAYPWDPTHTPMHALHVPLYSGLPCVWLEQVYYNKDIISSLVLPLALLHCQPHSWLQPALMVVEYSYMQKLSAYRLTTDDYR